MKTFIVIILLLCSFYSMRSHAYSDKATAYSACASDAASYSSSSAPLNYYCKDSNPNTGEIFAYWDIWYQYNYTNYTPNNDHWYQFSGGSRYNFDVICTGSFIYDSVSHSCAPPAPPCPSVGTKKIISAYQGEVLALPNHPPGGHVLEINDSTNTAVFDGAQYTYTVNDFSGTCFSESGKSYCTYNATATGVCSQPSSSKDALDAPASTPANPVNASQDGKCKTDVHGNTVCNTNDKANLKCGSVNGAEICIDQTSGTGTVNGQAVQASDKNCGFVNGKAVCIASDVVGATSVTTQGCIQSSAVRKCINSDLVKTSDTSTVSNPDGSTTQTTNNGSNQIGDNGSSTVTTTQANGNTTTTTTGSGSGSGSGNGSGEVKTDCEKFPDSLGCQNVKNNSEFVPEENPQQGQVTLSYSALSMGGSGSCPASENLTAFGRSYSLSYQPVCDFAIGLKPIILIMAAVAAAYIVFKGA